MDSKNNQKFVELLQLLELSNYEAKTYMAIIQIDQGTPLKISKESGVPQSKIYGVLKKLEDEGYISKTINGYKINLAFLSKQKQDVEKTFSDFLQFLEKKISSNLITEKTILNNIVPVLEKLEFDIEFKGRLGINKKFHDEYSPDTLARIHRMSLPEMVIATSSNSIIRVGILILTENSKEYFTSVGDTFIVKDLLRKMKLDKVIILTENISEKIIKNFTNVQFIPLTIDYVNKLKTDLVTFDKDWRKTFKKLLTLEKISDIPARKINRMMSKIAALRYHVTKIDKDPESYGPKIETWIVNAFNEIIDRIYADLKLNSELNLQQKLLLMNTQEFMKQKKSLPKTSDIDYLETELEWIIDDLDNLSSESSKLSYEISMTITDSPYQKVGFVANPFVFTIPIEHNLDIIGQKNTVLQLEYFVKKDFVDFSDNLALIVDEPGMGKTHLMKNCLKNINEKKSNTLGIFIHCIPNNDLFSLFYEIQTSLKRMGSSPLQSALLSILEKSPSPETTPELIDILRDLSNFAYDFEKTTLILFIDEFENLLTSPFESQATASQLTHILDVPNIGFVIVVREDEWNDNHQFRMDVSALEPELIPLEKYSKDDISLIVDNRLNSLSLDKKSKISFSSDAIEKISSLSHGNIRKAISLARDGFKKLVQMNKLEVTSDMIEDEFRPLNNYSNSKTGLQFTKKEVK